MRCGEIAFIPGQADRYTSVGACPEHVLQQNLHKLIFNMHTLVMQVSMQNMEIYIQDFYIKELTFYKLYKKILCLLI